MRAGYSLVWVLLQLVAALLVGWAIMPGASAQTADRYLSVVPVKGIINPVMASYVDRAIGEAEDGGAAAIVLEMDTPGGLDSSMREIIKRVISSRVPVIVYVSPPGSRAGSAGVYITLAAHVAAMAPNTNIGSASPVALGEGGEAQMSDTMKAKLTNDAVAYIGGLANSRGRNADWAEKAVREAVNIPAEEAQSINVVDLVAPDMASLLEQANGRKVRLASGEVTLSTKGVAVRQSGMSPVESFLHVISDPTIAYILLSVGTLGLIFELSNPGAILPGVVGGIFLLFALFGLGTLPINIAGVLLISFAFLLFVAEIWVPTHGILTGGAIISFVLGSMLLINTRDAPFLAISTGAIAGVTIGLTAFFVFLLAAVIRIRRKPSTMGMAGIIGQKGEARTPLNPGGMVFIDGALWEAVSEGGEIAEGEPVEVVEAKGFSLTVRKPAK